MEIRGKRILVTGASEGIGAACAREFARRGARLILTARREERLLELARPEDQVIAGDLTLPDFRERLAREAGPVDILVNNAGAAAFGSALEADEQTTRLMFELNLFAPWILCRLFAPAMMNRRSGAIVNISSAAGHVPLPWLAMYSASKSALSSMTAALRAEVAHYGVNVIAVWPGYIRTRFGDNRLSGRVPEFMRNPGAVSASAEVCARAVADAVESGASGVFTPFSARLFVYAHRLLPGVVEKELARRQAAIGKMSGQRQMTDNVE